MPRGSQPGERRGGRQKGTPNKRSIIKTREALWAYIEEQCALGKAANPFQVLVDTMVNDPAQRIQCANAIADRLLPRLKAIEISGDAERPLTITDATARQARITALLEKSTNGPH